MEHETNNDEDIRALLEENQTILKEMQETVEKIHTYLFWAFVAVLVSIVLPLIGMIFAIPAFLNRYQGLM